MDLPDNLDLIRCLPRLRRRLHDRSGLIRDLFATNASRPSIEEAFTGLFHSLLTDIFAIMPFAEVDYGYIRLWTASFADAFEIAFSPLKSPKGLKQHLDYILVLTCPRFQHFDGLHLEPFEVLFERAPQECVKEQDIQAVRFPIDIGFDNTFLLPFGFTDRFKGEFHFNPGEDPADFLKSPHISYAFNLYAPDYFKGLSVGDYTQWVGAVAALLRAERERESIPGAYLIIPVIDVNRSLACCCFAFARRLNGVHKLIFSYLITEMARMLSALESMALDSRSHTFYSATTSMLSFTHDFLGLLHGQ